MFYKTVSGAEVGDIYMSLIHTCRLCDVNPFDYLNALQQPRPGGDRPTPARWLPWNYREQLASRLSRRSRFATPRSTRATPARREPVSGCPP